MRTEQQRPEKYFDNNFRMMAHLTINNREVELVKEQVLLAAGQEIADLYQMLRYKSKQVSPLLSVL
jgi:hypothetical protein